MSPIHTYTRTYLFTYVRTQLQETDGSWVLNQNCSSCQQSRIAGVRRLRTYVYIYTYFLYKYIHIYYIHMHICTFVHMYIYIYTYVYTVAGGRGFVDLGSEFQLMLAVTNSGCKTRTYGCIFLCTYIHTYISHTVAGGRWFVDHRSEF